ncbi:NTP transferase domain-containing protein [Natronospora cellulosivora (SeqCode)]
MLKDFSVAIGGKQEMKIDVVVLAGAKTSGDFKKHTNAKLEALIKIAKIPMIDYVLRGANSASRTGKLVVVGSEKWIKPAINTKVDVFIESTDSMQENVINGLNYCNESDYVLLMTSDIPLVTAEIIDGFILDCLEDKNCDLYYPLISKELNEQKFPNTERTYIPLAEGVFTGGNMMLICPEVIKNTYHLLEKILKYRKKPWKLSKLLGLSFIFRFLLGHLSISDVEKKVEKLAKLKVNFMISNHPEVGFDVDKLSDLEAMQEIFLQDTKRTS